MEQSNAGDTGTLSMREKAQMKRRVTREHNSNFRAGYININEEYLHKTGIRGRKRYLFYCFVTSLVIVAVLNALLTASLVYFLHIYHTGMEGLEFVTSRPLLRFLQDTDIDTLSVHDSSLGARYLKDLKISGVNSPLIVRSSVVNGSSITVSDEKTVFETNNMSLIRSSTRLPLKDALNLHALSVVVDKLSSRHGYPDLFIESNKRVRFLGSKGVTLQSNQKPLDVESSLGSIHLNASRGSLLLQASRGLYISRNLPLLAKGSAVDNSLVTYKLCVCLPSGHLFAVAVTQPGAGCHTLHNTVNPCDQAPI